MIKLRKYCFLISVLCIISLIFPINVFAQTKESEAAGADAAGSGTAGAGIAGAKAGKETKAGISTGTIVLGAVGAALIIVIIAAAAGGGGGGGGSTPPPATSNH